MSAKDRQRRVTAVRVTARMLLAVLLAPLVAVFLLNAPAQAAGTVNVATADFQAGGDVLHGVYNFSTSCKVSGWWTTGTSTATLNVKGSCSTGWDVSSSKLTLTSTPAGSSCTHSWFVGEVDGSPNFSGAFGTCDLSTAGVITDLCYTIVAKSHSNPFSTSTFTGCATWNVGAPGAPSSTGNCPNGSVTGAEEHWVTTSTTTGMAGTITYTLPSQGVTSPWYYTTIARDPQGTIWLLTKIGSHVPQPWLMSSNGAPWQLADTQNKSAYGDFEGTGWHIIGVQVYYLWPTNDSRAVWQDHVDTLPQNGAGGDMGVTKPSACMWWFGEQLANQGSINDPTGEATATPAAPLGGSTDPSQSVPTPTPTNPNGDGCSGFSLTDPTTWAGAGICELVKMFSSLIGVVSDVLSAVLGLPAQILGGLGDLFQTLFVPSGEVDFTDLGDNLHSGNVGGWIDAVSGLVPSGGTQSLTVSRQGVAVASSSSTSGCEGPTVDLGSMGAFAGVNAPDNWHPFAACDGSVAQAASIVRNFAMWGIGLAGLFKVAQMIAASLGMIRNSAQMIKFDWSSPDSGVH